MTTTPVAMPFEANDFGPSVFQHSKSYGPLFPLQTKLKNPTFPLNIGCQLQSYGDDVNKKTIQ